MRYITEPRLKTLSLLLELVVIHSNNVYAQTIEGDMNHNGQLDVDDITILISRYLDSPSRTSGYDNGHAWVDLGLSVKWATMNIGASAPEEYGDLFAWGEVESYNSGKSVWNWDTYQWCDSTSSTLTKYNYASDYGETDGLLELLPEDDAAHMLWEGNWRIPAFNPDVWELYRKCTWTKTTLNSIVGYKVTGPNGNSIFLPASGWIHNDSFGGIGRGGDYWSRTLNPDDPTYAYGFWFFDDGLGWATRFPRDFGRRIRPITK